MVLKLSFVASSSIFLFQPFHPERRLELLSERKHPHRKTTVGVAIYNDILPADASRRPSIACQIDADWSDLLVSQKNFNRLKFNL